MRHLLIFESFVDDLDPMTRDIFGLQHTFEIDDYFGDTGIRITGPSENVDSAKFIIENIDIDIQRFRSFGKGFSRTNWVNGINMVISKWEHMLSKHGYKVVKRYNGASFKELSK